MKKHHIRKPNLKHKIFLYQEDFDKFTSGLNEVMTYIKDNSPEKDSEEKIESL